MEDLFESELLHVRREFLTADPAGAEHRDTRVRFGVQILRDELRQIAELLGFRIDRILECAVPEFVVVTRVEEREGAAFVEPILELLRSELG